jgi:hypothetical protein
LLNAAGVYMTERDKNTEDTLSMRSLHCRADNNFPIMNRLGTRKKEYSHTEDVRQRESKREA